MRAVLQRVSWAKVVVDADTVGEIAQGLCVLVGVADSDTPADAQWLARKVTSARIFEDDADKMNKSVIDVSGAILAISQFTLLGDARKGNRPSFSRAMEPVRARELFEQFCQASSTPP
jgi:D-tyrosyl-tRNA(Tyr) deacylase